MKRTFSLRNFFARLFYPRTFTGRHSEFIDGEPRVEATEVACSYLSKKQSRERLAHLSDIYWNPAETSQYTPHSVLDQSQIIRGTVKQNG